MLPDWWLHCTLDEIPMECWRNKNTFWNCFRLLTGCWRNISLAQKTFWNCVWTQDYFITWIKFLGNAGGIFHPKTLSRAVFPTRTQTFITWLFNVHKCLQTLPMPQTFSESVFGIHLLLFSQMKFTCGTMPKGHFLGAKKKLYRKHRFCLWYYLGLIFPEWNSQAMQKQHFLSTKNTGRMCFMDPVGLVLLNEIHMSCRSNIFSLPKTLTECVLWIQLAWFS